MPAKQLPSLRPLRRSAALVTLAALATLVAGNVDAGGVVLPLPAADASVLADELGAGVVGAALPSVPVTDLSRYFPLAEKARGYSVTSGARKGDTVQLGVARGTRPNGTPAWRFQIAPAESVFLHATPGGDLVSPALADSDEGLVIVLTPPTPFLWQGMQPGDTRTVAQRVSVKYLDDPSDEKYAGSLQTSATYVGTFVVTVPAGTYQAILMRHQFTGKVGPADTQDLTYYLLAPDVGVVAMVTQEDIEAFWIVHVDTTTGKVLAAE